MGDDEVETVVGVAADRRGGVLDDERAVRDGDLLDERLVEAVHRVDDRLTEREVVGRARGHDPDAEGIESGRSCVGGLIVLDGLLPLLVHRIVRLIDGLVCIIVRSVRGLFCCLVRLAVRFVVGAAGCRDERECGDRCDGGPSGTGSHDRVLPLIVGWC